MPAEAAKRAGDQHAEDDITTQAILRRLMTSFLTRKEGALTLLLGLLHERLKAVRLFRRAITGYTFVSRVSGQHITSLARHHSHFYQHAQYIIMREICLLSTAIRLTTVMPFSLMRLVRASAITR